MDNPFAVGEAIGAGLVFAVTAFVVARKLCGPAGARHLARLKRIAGEEVQESTLSLYVRDWLPYAAAFMAALVGALFGLANAGIAPHRSSATLDMPRLIAGFKNGCQRSCAAGRDVGSCEEFCDCTLAELRAGHPGDEAFASWMQAGPQNMDAVRAEVLSARATCAPALESGARSP